MNKKKEKIIIWTSLFLILLFGTLYNTYKDNDIHSNLGITKGIVVDYSFTNNNYALKFEYIVDGKKYVGREFTSFFKCDDGVPGCKGRSFTVKYSTKNPSNAEMEIGKYNHKKLTQPKFK